MLYQNSSKGNEESTLLRTGCCHAQLVSSPLYDCCLFSFQYVTSFRSFSISLKTEFMSIFYCRCDHESIGFQKLAINKCICRKNVITFLTGNTVSLEVLRRGKGATEGSQKKGVLMKTIWKLKRRFFDFKQKKETRRTGINPS